MTILAFSTWTRPGTIPFGVTEGDSRDLLIPKFCVLSVYYIKLASVALEHGASKNSGNKAAMLTATCIDRQSLLCARFAPCARFRPKGGNQ